MKDYPWKDDSWPSYEEIQFLYNVCKHETDTTLINYLSLKFNSINNINERKLNVYRWIQALKWIIQRVESYDRVDFHNSFCKRVFCDTFHEKDNFNSLYDALEILENLQNYFCLQKANEEEVILYSRPDISDEDYKRLFKDELVQANKDAFESYDMEEQKYILSIYQQFCKSREYFLGIHDPDIADDFTIDDIAGNSVSDQYKTEENMELIRQVCKSLMRKRVAENIKSFPDSEIANLIDKEIRIEENLNLVAYFLQYIIISLGAPISVQKPLNVMKVSGKQSDILQRLLCALTTQEWKKADGKGLLYYKTVNNMFRIDKDNVKEGKRKILTHLAKVRIMLENGGFDDAVQLLDKDVKTITDEKLQPD